MKKMRIPDEFKSSGSWFLPESPDDRVQGTLHWDGELAHLEIDISSSKTFGGVLPSTEIDHFPCIHGVTWRGQNVSLLGVTVSRRQIIFDTPAKHIANVISPRLIFGEHVQESSNYLEMHAWIPGFAFWLRPPIASPVRVQGSDDLKITVPAPAGEEMKFPVHGFDLFFFVDSSLDQSDQRVLQIQSTGFLVISAHEAKPLLWFQEQLQKIVSLLTFLASQPMFCDRTAMLFKPNAELLPLLQQTNFPMYCSIQERNQFFMTGDRIPNKKEVLGKWFDAYDQMRVVCGLALETLLTSTKLRHVNFNLLMQSLEGFHRSFFQGLYMDKDTYDGQIYPAIVSAIPSQPPSSAPDSDHRAALKARLKYGNEISLRNRLKELALSIDEPLRKVILGPMGTVPGSWPATRNYYTHWDESSREIELTPTEEMHARARMRVMLRCLFLLKAGVPSSELQTSLTRLSDDAERLRWASHVAPEASAPGLAG